MSDCGDRPPVVKSAAMLDDRIRFLPGWFAESLAPAPIDEIAVLRLDGDLHGSTMAALETL